MVTNPVKALFPPPQNRSGASGRKHKLADQTHTHTTRLSRPLVSGINLFHTYLLKNLLRKPHKQQLGKIKNKKTRLLLHFQRRDTKKKIVRHPTEAGRPVRETKIRMVGQNYSKT